MTLEQHCMNGRRAAATNQTSARLFRSGRTPPSTLQHHETGGRGRVTGWSGMCPVGQSGHRGHGFCLCCQRRCHFYTHKHSFQETMALARRTSAGKPNAPSVQAESALRCSALISGQQPLLAPMHNRGKISHCLGGRAGGGGLDGCVGGPM